jgi:two-component system cell cycle response regulator
MRLDVEGAVAVAAAGVLAAAARWPASAVAPLAPLAAVVLAGHFVWRECQLRRARAAAARDEATGLGNRRALFNALERTVARARRQGRPFALILVDLDGFKAVNDRFGHAAGDRLLRAAGAAIRSSLRRRDMAFRYGGDEFAVLLPGVAPSRAEPVAERLRQRVGRTAVEAAANARAGVTASCGVAGWSPGERPPRVRSVFAAVDECLYDAKLAGRNRVRRQPGDDGPDQGAPEAS